MRSSSPKGFTLIELMITVAIVGILGTVGYSSYVESIRRNNRAQAKSILLESAQLLERNYSEANRYDQVSSGAAYTLPYLTAPKSGTAVYNLSFAAGSPTATSFVILAVPTGAQTGDKCGTFSINNAGQQQIVGGASGVTAASCWEK